MKKRENFRHLTAGDRDRVHALYGYGHDQSDIARVLGVHKGTISRELRRYDRKTWRYSAARAQKDAEEKRARSKRPGMKIADDPALRRYVVSQLKHLRSPDEIAGRMEREGRTPRVGTGAIYKWLYRDGNQYCKYLCTRRIKKRCHPFFPARPRIPDRKPLKDRPNDPSLVHAEGDLFTSSGRFQSKACALIMAEKGSRLLAGSMVADRRASSIAPAMREAVRATGAHTCTLDNGIENIHHREFGVDAYFCDPGTPTQKPLVESSIGLMRRWFIPRGTDLNAVSDASYRSAIHALNHKHRKSLGYRSAYEDALERGIIKKVPKISLAGAVAFR